MKCQNDDRANEMDKKLDKGRNVCFCGKVYRSNVEFVVGRERCEMLTPMQIHMREKRLPNYLSFDFIAGFIFSMEHIISSKEQFECQHKICGMNMPTIFDDENHPARVSFGEFVKRCRKIKKYELIDPSSLVFAIALVNRVLNRQTLCVNRNNIHMVFYSAMLLANKQIVDIPYNNSSFSYVMDIKLTALNQCEMELLKALNFDTNVCNYDIGGVNEWLWTTNAFAGIVCHTVFS